MIKGTYKREISTKKYIIALMLTSFIFLIGLLVGWPNILIALFSAFLVGAIVGLVLISMKKKTLKSEVPFGPFLIIGIYIALFFGDKIVNWYLGFLFL